MLSPRIRRGSRPSFRRRSGDRATKAAIRAVYPNYDLSKPPPLDYHGGGGAVPTAPTTPGTTLNTPPPATSIANALAGGTGANGQGLSPIQQAQKDVRRRRGGQALQPAPAPQLGPGDMHNAQVAAQAPQLMAALRTGRRAALELGLQAVRLDCRPARRGDDLAFGGQAVPMPGQP